MQSTRFESWQVLNTQTSFHTEKHLLTRTLSHCGKFHAEPNLMCVYSIIMQYADGGDLLQKINEAKRDMLYFKES